MKKKNKPLFNQEEKKNVTTLGMLLFFRMTGVFLVLPIFSPLATDIPGATSFLIGISFGIYGLTQGIFQLPFGILSDRIGRKKVLFLAFFLFFVGSLICAFASNMIVLILGRLLQGVGAVSSAMFALIADLTRPEVRTRANALLGMSIGVSFGLSFLFAPILGEYLGLNGVFGLIALMALLSLVVLIFKVPSPPIITDKKTAYRELILSVLKNKQLATIYFGSFAGGCGLSTTMFLAPLEFRNLGIPIIDLWKIYIPMLIVGVLFMIPSAIIAETKKKYREVFFVGIFLFFISAICGIWIYSLEELSLWGVILFLFLFFAAYNVFEPLFPSIATKLSTKETKGTVSGMVNFFQFLGYFVGSTIAGTFYTIDFNLIFYILLFFYGLFLLSTWKMNINQNSFT